MKELKEIKLFKRLEKLDKDFASQLKKTANKIKELINKKTTINFPNYTNHDINHSFKLMDTMYELIKDNKKDFNALEIALMIYSCLFHDIGMAMSDDEIKKIKDNTSKYLYGQDFKEIVKNNFNNEDLALQEVIRVSHGKIAYDLITIKYEEEVRLPEHENISFAQSLAEICLSHTKDRSYVEGLESNSIKGEYEYNTQFLSILLRLADILDIDSTRTPLSLYEAMNLNDFSNGEWKKNFSIDNIKKIFKSNDLKEIKLEGICKDIKIHRKLLGYIKWIENELKLAVDLTANMNKKYHIKLNTEVKNKIKPIGYTIPDLKLNMDYHAVTNLLMGEAIYGSKDLGLRELLQNSIDAIMVKKDKLEMDNHPSKNSYEPTINIDIDKENNKVIISDNGMGMNEYIIKNYFLNVGKSYYKSKDFLNYKHNYNPIGNFGIGFLSCFMLSDEVQVITKHFNSNKKYTINLEKSSEYIAFKEEEDNSNVSGTKIILRLNNLNKIFNSDDELELKISDFIKENILIDNYVLEINKKNINTFPNKEIVRKEIDTKRLHRIDVSKYLKDIKGEIVVRQNEYSNSLINELTNIKHLVYFNGSSFEEITDYEEIKSEYILQGWNLTYLKIPLLKQNAENTFETLIESGHIDQKEALDFIINKQKDIRYIYLFINKNCNWEGTHYYGDFYDKEDYIFYYEEDENIFEFTIQNIIDFLKIKTYEIIGGLSIEKELIYKNDYLFPYKRNKYATTLGKTYIKNIRINHRYDNYLIADIINILNINLNTKNNELIPNVSRDKFIYESEKKLTNSIFKLIHQFALNNFDLNEDEKKLLNAFILLNYKEDKEIEK